MWFHSCKSISALPNSKQLIFLIIENRTLYVPIFNCAGLIRCLFFLWNLLWCYKPPEHFLTPIFILRTVWYTKPLPNSYCLEGFTKPVSVRLGNNLVIILFILPTLKDGILSCWGLRLFAVLLPASEQSPQVIVKFIFRCWLPGNVLTVGA